MSTTLRSFGAAVLLVLGGARPPLAQTSHRPPEPGWKPSATITPWFQGSADLSGGGGFEASGGMFRAGVDGPVGSGHRAGLTLTYEYTDYSFSSPAAFGHVAPWTDVHHLGLAVAVLLPLPSAWSLLVRPSFDFFMEDGADWGEATTYGAVLAVSKRFGADLRLGLGVSAFDRLEEVGVMPFPVVDWRITDQLRLTNPLDAGPTGGAGLELSYQLDGGWTIGAGGAFRSARFRLRDRGPFERNRRATRRPCLRSRRSSLRTNLRAGRLRRRAPRRAAPRGGLGRRQARRAGCRSGALPGRDVLDPVLEPRRDNAPPHRAAASPID